MARYSLILSRHVCRQFSLKKELLAEDSGVFEDELAACFVDEELAVCFAEDELATFADEDVSAFFDEELAGVFTDEELG